MTAAVAATKPAPLPVLKGLDAPKEWLGVALATVNYDGEAYPAFARDTFGEGVTFVEAGKTLDEGIATATKLAGTYMGGNMRGPAAVGVLQAKDGAYFATYLSSHSGQNRYPYNFDKMDSATRNVDALKGIVGTTKWIPFVNERDAGNPTNAQSAQELPSA